MEAQWMPTFMESLRQPWWKEGMGVSVEHHSQPLLPAAISRSCFQITRRLPLISLWSSSLLNFLRPNLSLLNFVRRDEP